MFSQRAVYPRGYGEHYAGCWYAAYISGLSPWVRGTPAHTPHSAQLLRFIPVGTGNTAGPAGHVNGWSVYPRGYGEHAVCYLVPLRVGGLSPWVRGTPASIFEHCRLVRFIPVGTGNTQLATIGIGSGAVYPRGYGEHSYFGFDWADFYGLSPWVRGTQKC